ncbi:MAG: hypothetical protein KGJ07_01580 [Patescibacteria group bacterium]|nr:hypothetical protein [Patescibacteria group bacterium]
MNNLKLYVLSAGEIQVVVFAESIQEADELVIKQYDLDSIAALLEPNTGNKYWVHIETYDIAKGVVRK